MQVVSPLAGRMRNWKRWIQVAEPRKVSTLKGNKTSNRTITGKISCQEVIQEILAHGKKCKEMYNVSPDRQKLSRKTFVNI